MGKISITVEPEDKNIKISFSDDFFKKKYRCPLVEKELIPGKYLVEIIPPVDSIYKSKIEEFFVKPGDHNLRKIKLDLKTKQISSSPNLNDSLLFLNGKRLNKSELSNLKVPVGKHKITAVLKNGLIYQNELIVKTNDEEVRLINPNKGIFSDKAPIIKTSKPNTYETGELEKISTIDNTIILKQKNGSMVAIDAFDHHTKWTFQKYKVISNPYIIQGRLFAICEKKIPIFLVKKYKILVEFNKENGRPIWHSDTISQTPSITVTPNFALFVFDSKKIYSIFKRGEKPKLISLKELHRESLNRYEMVIPFIGNFKHRIGDHFIDFKNEYGYSFQIKKNRTWNFEIGSSARDNISLKKQKGEFLYVFYGDGSEMLKISPTNENPPEHHRLFFKGAKISEFKIDKFGNFVIVSEDKNLTIYSPELKTILWKKQYKQKIIDIEVADSVMALLTVDGSVETLGYPFINKAIGWVKKIRDNGDVVIKKCIHDYDGALKFIAFKPIDIDRINKWTMSSLRQIDVQPNSVKVLYSKNIFNRLLNEKSEGPWSNLKSIVRLVKFTEVVNGNESELLLRANTTNCELHLGDVLFFPSMLQVASNPVRENNDKFDQKARQLECSVLLDNEYLGKTSNGNMIFLNFPENRISSLTVIHPEQSFPSVAFIREDILSERSLTKNFSKAKFINLIISVFPKTAKIWIDNQDMGEEKYKIQSIRMGRIINVEIKKEGFSTVKDIIKIDENFLRSISSEDENTFKKYYTLRYPSNFYDISFSMAVRNPLHNLKLNWQNPEFNAPIDDNIRNHSKSFTKVWSIWGEFSLSKLKTTFMGIKRLGFFGAYSGSIGSNIYFSEEEIDGVISNHSSEYGISFFLANLGFLGETKIGLSRYNEESNTSFSAIVDNGLTLYSYFDVKKYFYLWHVFLRPHYKFALQLSVGSIFKGKMSRSSSDAIARLSTDDISGNLLRINAFVIPFEKYPIRFILSYEEQKIDFGDFLDTRKCFSFGISWKRFSDLLINLK